MKKIYNKLMAIIFSPSTPIQLLLVTIFGFVFGFVPGFVYSPLLFLLVLLLVLILRVNIGFFVIISIFAKLISYPLEGINFTIGRWLLDGFTQPIFKAAVNTPVLAYAGFEYYLVTGAVAVALILGIIVGIVIGRLYKNFVTKMVGIQEGSEFYQKFTSKLSVKIASKVIFGKNISKVDWKQIQARRFLQPFRIWGVVLVILIAMGVSFVPQLLEISLISNIIKQQLTKANGATVDYKSLHLSLSDARLQINGLGATDPNNLNKDRFYAKSISASINVSNLLTKQIALKDVIVDGVVLDKQRQTPGKLYINKLADQSSQQQQITNQQVIDTIKDYGKNIQQIDLNKITENTKEAANIAKGIKQGAEFLARFRSSSTESAPKAKNELQTPTLTQQAQVYGYAEVKNENLRDKAPSFAIQNIDIKNYEDAGTVYAAQITNLSTNPALLAKPTTVDIKSINNSDLSVNVVVSNQANIDNTIKFTVQNIAGNAIKGLNIQGVGLDAKNLNITGQGKWYFSGVNNVNFNIPLKLKLQNVGVNFNNFKQNIPSLTLNAVISGNLKNIGFGIDISSLKDILNSDTVKNTASQIAKQAGLDKKAQQLLENTKINGKSIKDLNTKDLKKINKQDVQNLASSFGIKIQ